MGGRATTSSRRRRVGVLAGLGIGLLAGVLASTVLSAPLPAHSSATATALDVTHNAPLLSMSNERVELAYQVTCPYAQNLDHECKPSGVVHLKTLAGTVDLPLSPGGPARDSQLYATVPSGYLLPGSALSYWATFTDATSGAQATLPRAGAGAPSTLWVLSSAQRISLPGTFDPERAPDAQVVSGGWGAGTGRFGLEEGDQSSTIGAASFDIDPQGILSILDQVNRRIVRYQAGTLLDSVAVDVTGARGDLSEASDGTYSVLEEKPDGQTLRPLVKRFSHDGVLLSTQSVGDLGANEIRNTTDGPTVHVLPADQWEPLLDPQGQPLSLSQLTSLGVAIRRVASTGLVVKVTAHEMRIAEIGSTGAVARAWQVTSPANLGESQVVEKIGDDLAVVVRQFSDDASQFRYARLNSSGVTQTFTIDPAEWAETAPLSRFRMANGALYQARSTPDGLSIVRFDLGG